MNKKQVLITAFISLLLFSALAGRFLSLVEANFIPEQPPQGIRIGSDGNVEGTNKIRRNGNVYTLTANIYDTIVVLRDNIVIDGAGYALQGYGSSSGIFLQERNNVIIKNMEIKNFYYGIKLTWGWALDGSRNNNIFENTITNNTIGILLTLFSGNNFVSENTITNNKYGISIHYSKNNVLRNNSMNNNTYNFWVDAELSHHMSDFVNDIDDSNTVDGKPIYYWVNKRDKTIPSDAGYVGLVSCTGIKVQNLNLANNGQGVLLVSTNNSLITKNHITNNGYGIAVYGPYVPCAYNSITENRVTENAEDGIYLWGGYSDIIIKNYITNNQENGINSFDSRDVNIIGNNITANKENGIKLWGGSSNNVVSENYLANNENGITLDSSSNNDIIGNTIIANKGWGIILTYIGFPTFSSNNTIYHNNFVNDQQAVYTAYDPLPLLPESPPIDIWDNGFEGNYWSNYTGTDSNGDGIGDTPYIINADNQDNYPLMEPVVIPAIEIPEISDGEAPTTPPTDPSPTSQPPPSPLFIAMPEEYINYTISRVNGSLWAKVDGTYPLYVSYEKFGFDDESKLDDTSLLVTSDELPMFYPIPPGTTNISVKMSETELNWSNYTKTHPEATHHTAIGDWPMIYCTIHPVPDHFILKIHYEHPIILINGNYTFLYDLNISPYLSPWCNKSTAYFNIRMETPYANLHVYTTGSNEAWKPLNYTITRGNTAETITLQIVSEYSKPLLGDLVISFTEDEAPESTNPGFLGTTLPIEYGYAIIAVIGVAIASVAGYLFLKRIDMRFNDRYVRARARCAAVKTFAVVSALLFSMVAGTLLIGFGTANPVPPVSTISITSPQQNKVYTVNSVSLTFSVRIDIGSSASPIGKPSILYYLDGNLQGNFTSRPTSKDLTENFSVTLTGLSDGLHWVQVTKTAHWNLIMIRNYTETRSSITVYFTVDTTPPRISIRAPLARTYNATDIPLNFTVNEPVSWIGYSLDTQANVTITKNTTLNGLSYGSHNLTVYAKDTAGNTGYSKTMYFSIAQKTEPQQSQPFPTTWIIAATAMIAMGVTAPLVYFTKVRKTTEKAE